MATLLLSTCFLVLCMYHYITKQVGTLDNLWNFYYKVTLFLACVACGGLHFISNFGLNLTNVKVLNDNLAHNIGKAYLDEIKNAQLQKTTKEPDNPIFKTNEAYLVTDEKEHSNDAVQFLGIFYNNNLHSKSKVKEDQESFRKQNVPFKLNADNKVSVLVNEKLSPEHAVQFLGSLYNDLRHRIKEAEEHNCSQVISSENYSARKKPVVKGKHCYDYVQLLGEVYNNTIKFIISLSKNNNSNISIITKIPRIAKAYHRRYKNIVVNVLNTSNIHSKSEPAQVVNASFTILSNLFERAFEMKTRRKVTHSEQIILRRALAKAMSTELDRVCKEYGTCPPLFGFKDYCKKIVILMLKSDDFKLTDMWIKWLRSIKMVGYGNLMTGHTLLQFRVNMRYLEVTDSPSILKIKLTEMKNYIEKGKLLLHHPSSVKARLGYSIDLIELVHKILVHDQEMIEAWEHLEKALKNWLTDSAFDTVTPFKNVVVQMVKRFTELEPDQLRELKAKIHIVVDPPPLASLE